MILYIRSLLAQLTEVLQEENTIVIRLVCDNLTFVHLSKDSILPLKVHYNYKNTNWNKMWEYNLKIKFELASININDWVLHRLLTDYSLADLKG